MDITKMPLPGAAGAGAPSSMPQPGAQPPARMVQIADHADIRPLDIPAALQILLAEVRASFELQAIAMGSHTGAGAESPAQTAGALLQMVLQALPDESAGTPASSAEQWGAAQLNAEQWNAMLVRVESALQAGLDRAISAVTAWRDVPGGVVDAAKDTRALVFAILGDDPQDPIWLRPEWVGLAPRFERFWRRRRSARRHLSDPDYYSGSFDDGSEPRP
ncbi:MAG TPA: hypothetical protein VHU43_02520 [Steroidobacteraceae bacterium]|jgi:hypothetical protein|nr:hypothetical protein [Steroidobacteraceae bacterium]